MRRALITGIGGQDGTYLAECLLRRGAEVLGIERPGSANQLLRDLGLLERIRLVTCDIADPAAVRRLIAEEQPTEIHHLAAVSFVPDSWTHPMPTVASGVLSITAIVDAVLASDRSIRIVQASSAEVFGRPASSSQDEDTPVAPVTPYGATKAFALSLGRMYRERFGLAISTAILYNHESPRRSERFVSRKVTRAAAEISLGLASELRLGSLDAVRDWSYAGDITEGLALMAEAESGDDYVLASGEARTVEDMLDAAFGHVGLDWREHVVQDPELVRPTEAHRLCGNPSKAEQVLGWRRTTTFDEMIGAMVEHDLAVARA